MVAILVPLWIGIFIEGAAFGLLFGASFAVTLLAVLWTGLVLAIATRPVLRSESIAAISIGAWVILTLAIPISGKVYIESSVSGVKGAEVALVQRESVNDAWDLPKSVTMDAFYASHPEWADSAPINEEFHWKWYYAFQQVGDESAAELSRDYRAIMLVRDELTARVSFLSPAVAIQRQLETLARTNLSASLEFEDQVRSYHEEIRRAYYPVLFSEEPFSSERLAQITIPGFSNSAQLAVE